MGLERVVVVDGYDESRDASARELRSAGYEVVAVEEEDEAVRAVQGARVDIVLLDVPISEAGEAAAAVRAAATSHRPTIIAIVAPSDSRQLREEIHARGVDYFFLRPCPPPAVVKHLKRMFPPPARGPKIAQPTPTDPRRR